ncbi:OmpL47-type beta-barrel domain-containing protein [Ekhidna sp.]
MKIRKITFLIAVIGLCFNLFAQQVAMTDSQIKPDDKLASPGKKTTTKNTPPLIVKDSETVYVSEGNKTYVNKNLPIYLKFSTTPNGETHDLKSLSHPEDTEPLYLDTEGANYIRTKWAVDPETKEYAYPLREIQMELYADSKPPVVRPVFNSSALYKKNDVTYYGNDLSIEFVEWDEQSGVKSSFWSLNNKDWSTGGVDFKNESTDEYSFAYYSVDNVNNYTDTKTVSFVYDKTAPKTTLNKTTNGNYVFGPKTSLQFEVIEEHSGLKSTYFKLADNAYIKVRSDQTMPSSMQDGEYELSYYSVDNVINGEDLRIEKVYLDKIAPQSTLNATSSFMDGKRLYVSPSSKISLSATDNKAGVDEIMYSTRGVSNETYDESFSIQNYHGMTFVSFTATDMVGNVEIKNQQEIFVDSLRPSTQIEFVGDYFEVANRYYINESTQLKLTSSDQNSGVAYTEYSAIGSDFKKYDDTFKLSNEGYNGIMYRSVDNVDNVEYSKSIDLYLDKKGPEIVFNFSNQPIGEEDGIKIYPVGTRLFLGATDDQSGTNSIAYQVNNQKEVYYSSPKTIDISEKKAFKRGKVFEVKITTTDLVKNATSETIKFKIED